MAAAMTPPHPIQCPISNAPHTEAMNCKICGHPAEQLFSARILGKYDVAYSRCSACGFMQTEEPYWLVEAYADAVSVYDVWSVSRPWQHSTAVARLIEHCFADSALPFLDFGGGTGIFVRAMRDLGYPFLRADAYSPNLYARLFDLTDHPSLRKFSLITCFEVFEHLPDPLADLRSMFALADTVFISTNLIPAGVKSVDDWYYFAPFHGQHVSFYTVAALQELARITGSRLLTDGENHHLLTRADLGLTPADFAEIVTSRPAGLVRRMMRKAGNALLHLSRSSKWRHRDSLTWPDYVHVTEKLGRKTGR